MGAFLNFATNANSIDQLLDGIHINLLTLASNFRIPLFRDLLLSAGVASVSRESCERILSKGPGRAIMIGMASRGLDAVLIGKVVGGAHESLVAYPNEMNLVIKKRLGFIKLAIRNG